MSRTCAHGYIATEHCMGYVPEPPPFRPNLDRHGMPRDYATYEWLLYHKIVRDDSPQRRVFLHGPSVSGGWEHPRIGTQAIRR